MSTPVRKLKSEDINLGSPAPSQIRFIDASYYSNRENGQIVKRESPCDIRIAEVVNLKGVPYSGYLSASNEGGTPDTFTWVWYNSTAFARAYGKFKRMADIPSTELLLNVVERRKSLEMIAARAFQARSFLSALRRGRLGDAWEYMCLNPDKSLLGMKSGRRSDSRFVSGKLRERGIDSEVRWRQLLKDVGSLVLELRYGFAPLMQDIKSGIEVFQKPIEPKAIVARATVRTRKFLYVQNEGVRSFDVYGTITEKSTIKGVIVVKDPSAALANQLGLINPASIAWETIPFSFLIDWFLPVGNYLSSLTDMVGLELTQGSFTGTRTCYAEIPRRVNTHFSVQQFQVPMYGVRSKRITRVVGTDLPKPPLVTGSGLSPGRAVNAIALLLQQFDPKRIR